MKDEYDFSRQKTGENWSWAAMDYRNSMNVGEWNGFRKDVAGIQTMQILLISLGDTELVAPLKWF